MLRYLCALMVRFWQSLRSVAIAAVKKTPPSAKTPEGRRLIAQHTLKCTKSVIEEHANEGATEDSIFYPKQLPTLPPLNASKSLGEGRPVLVVNSDSFTAARKLFDEHPDAKGSVAVLNLASDEEPAGGWLSSYTRTQEEALCYSSTLYATLKPSYYPWPNLGPGSIAGIFSPGVVIFKDDLYHDCAELPKSQRRVVSVITVAGPRRPKLTADGEGFANGSDLEDLRGKIRLVYRMAAHHKQRNIVLGKFGLDPKERRYLTRLLEGALGCGVYACPPKLVAKEMKNILLDQEFRNYFEHVVFAVYNKGNFIIFRDAFTGIKV